VRGLLLVLLLSACAPSSFVGFTMVRPDDDTGDDPVDDPTTPVEDGTAENPFVIPVQDGFAQYADARDTTDAPSDRIDLYPPYPQDESGPEYFYTFEVDGPVSIRASLAYPEPSGVDNDIHLLTSTDPASVIDRAHYAVSTHLEAGTYFLVVDTYVDDGVPLTGPYTLDVSIRPLADGTVDDPIPLAPGPLALPYFFTDTADTRDSFSSDIDAYPPFSANQSGPEIPIPRSPPTSPGRRSSTSSRWTSASGSTLKSSPRSPTSSTSTSMCSTGSTRPVRWIATTSGWARCSSPAPTGSRWTPTAVTGTPGSTP